MTTNKEERGKLTTFLKEMCEKGGSDLHITASSPPQIRQRGDLMPLDYPPLSAQDTLGILTSFLPDSKRQRLEKERELRYSFDVEGLARFRKSLFYQQGTLAGIFRLIPNRLEDFDELYIPPVVQEMCTSKSGLLVISGTRSSGRSTTLAAIIDWINTHSSVHILTIEDPIEYVHTNKKSIISQREVEEDVLSLLQALKSARIEDTDVIMISELNDGESTEQAMEAALSGHLVLTSVSSISVLDAIYKLIEWFPPHKQARAKSMLSSCIQGIIHQNLVPRTDGKGMVMASETLVQNPQIKSLIREDKMHQIFSSMQSHASMNTMNQSLAKLISNNVISKEMALEATLSKNELLDLLSRL